MPSCRERRCTDQVSPDRLHGPRPDERKRNPGGTVGVSCRISLTIIPACRCAHAGYLLRSTPQQSEGRLVDSAVAGGDDASALFPRIAGPGGDDAPGAGDDRNQGRDVMGLELGLDDEIDEAGGEHAIGVAVAAVTR